MAYWLDEGWHSWPEVVRAGTPAAGLYSRCGSWIADHATDGLIPSEVVRMYGTVDWARRLVDAGLWTPEGDGYRDARYFPLNPTRADIDKRKAAAAARQRKRRHGKHSRESRVTDTVTLHVTSPPPSPLAPPTGGLGRVGASEPVIKPHAFEEDAHGNCKRCPLPRFNAKIHPSRRSKESA